MRYLKNNLSTVLIAAVLAVILLRFEPQIARLRERLAKLAQLRLFWIIAGAAFAAFYIGCVLTRPVHYQAYHGGSMGDNYNYAHHGFSERHYYIPHHLYWPFVPAQAVHTAMDLGWLDRNDPMLLEKVFTLYSLPQRLFVLVGGWFFFLLLRKMRIPPLESALGALFLFATFGYWFWALQTNAMGVLIPWTIVAVWSVVTALEKRRIGWFMLSGLLTSLCMYIHISSYYLTIGLGLAVFAVSLRRAWRDRNWRELAGPALFGLVAATMGLLLLGAAARYYKSTDFNRIMSGLADYPALGTFRLDAKFLARWIGGSISTNLAMILGLVQSGEKLLWERMLIKIQFACLLLLIISLRQIRWRALLSIEQNIPIWVIGGAFLASVTGFALRITWPQYYAAITAVTALLIVGSAFYPARRTPPAANMVALGLLTFAMMLSNGTGSATVFQGEGVESHPVYRQLRILESLSAQWDRPIRFVGRPQEYGYNFRAIMSYYALSPKFQGIEWVEPADLDGILAEWRKAANPPALLLNSADYPSLLGSPTKAGQITKISTGSPDYPMLYLYEERKVDSSLDGK